jgi:hypothetical protein
MRQALPCFVLHWGLLEHQIKDSRGRVLPSAAMMKAREATPCQLATTTEISQYEADERTWKTALQRVSTTIIPSLSV